MPSINLSTHVIIIKNAKDTTTVKEKETQLDKNVWMTKFQFENSKPKQ